MWPVLTLNHLAGIIILAGGTFSLQILDYSSAGRDFCTLESPPDVALEFAFKTASNLVPFALWANQLSKWEQRAKERSSYILLWWHMKISPEEIKQQQQKKKIKETRLWHPKIRQQDKSLNIKCYSGYIPQEIKWSNCTYLLANEIHGQSNNWQY